MQIPNSTYDARWDFGMSTMLSAAEIPIGDEQCSQPESFLGNMHEVRSMRWNPHLLAHVVFPTQYTTEVSGLPFSNNPAMRALAEQIVTVFSLL